MRQIRIFLVLFVALVIGALAAIFLLHEKRPEPREIPKTEAPTAKSAESQPGEIDLQTTHRLGIEDITPLYASLAGRIVGYRSVVVRTHIDFPKLVPNHVFEAEFRFDAIRPERFIHRSFSSQPEDKKNLAADWVLKPLRSESSDGKTLFVVSHNTRNYHKVDLTATDKASKALVATMKVKCATRLANPLQDLLYPIPFEDRLKEMLEAKRERTSRGEEVRVLFRMNRAMNKRLLGNLLTPDLPVVSEKLNDITMREDVFDQASGGLLETVYCDLNRKPFLSQTYSQIEWDAEIPDDRFALDMPEGAKPRDLNEILRRNQAWAIKVEDMNQLMQGAIPLPATGSEELKEKLEELRSRPPHGSP
jgi:hypothetical protein